MAELLLYERRDHIVYLTFNQPEILNAFYDDGPFQALRDALRQLNEDGEARVAILTGAGKAFSAGGNLRKMASEGGLASKSPLEIRQFFRKGIIEVVTAFERLEVPIIAAVNGPAYGAGLGIACLCDIRYASENATFCETFTKLGVVPPDGDAWLLPRLIGAANYAELLFTAEPIGAAEAFNMGLVSKVLPPDELMPSAAKLAERIAANAPEALRMSKLLMKEGQRTDLLAHLELAATMVAILQRTGDHREALNAFLERRPPKFSGE